MSAHTTTTNAPTLLANQPSTWLERWQQQDYFFRPVAFFTIVIGICLHVGRLLLGDEILFQQIFTPFFDQLFAIPIVYAGISGLLSWWRMEFRSRGHKVFIGFIVFYMVASIPIHLLTWFTHSTEHLQVFPMWFSLLLQPYYAAVLVALWRVQFKAETK